MKVDVFRMLMNLAAICAVSSFVLLSAAATPQSDEQKLDEKSPLIPSTSNETVSASTTKAAEETQQTENASVEDASTTDTSPPIFFPTDEDKISPKNDTALKILQNTTTNVIVPEIEKSNETSEEVTSPSASPPQNATTTTLSISADATANDTTNATSTDQKQEDDYDNVSKEDDSDAENIQDTPDQLQDQLEEQFARNGSDKASIKIFEDPVTNEPALHSGHFALIFASTLIVLSVVAYVGLVLWRSRLESRYGMRQRLVTEDAFYSDNNNDVRYFGL